MKTTSPRDGSSVNRKSRWLATAGFAVLAAMPFASAMAQGTLVPGVYGRIEFGTAPPPPVIYQQPVIIQRPAVMVQQPPLYLHVPPGHAKKWSKHCAQYNACGQPVYFVKVAGDDRFEREQYREKHKDKHKGKGKHHGRDHDD
ncbi:MAG: hypothetical protein V4573_06455 [Pseudomonadota bacterium]